MIEPQALFLDPDLLERFFQARSVSDVEKLIAEVEAARACAWFPVGGDDMNVPSIEPGTNPPLQLIERVVNGFDGCLELMKARSEGDPPGTPFAAAQKWA